MPLLKSVCLGTRFLPVAVTVLAAPSVLHGLPMATLLESAAAFKSRALEHGLVEADVDRLKNAGITNLSKLAFAITTPGITPPDDALKGLLADDVDTVNIGQLSSIRRLMFDAQTLSAAQIKSSLAGSDTAKRVELVPAERAQRIQEQKTRLAGMELTGPYECSHCSYDYVAKMLECNAPSYLEPHRFTTRASEVGKEKPGKELVLDHTHLTVKDGERKDKCSISNELQLFQAFARRALACDLMQACSFKTMERWHRFLMDHMQLPAPPHFKPPTMEQVLRTDRAAWVRMAEMVPSLKRTPAGALPLDAALDDLRSDPTVLFHLMPLPANGPSASAGPSDSTTPLGAKKMPKTTKPANKSKGRGKGSGKPASKGKMPAELLGLHQQTKDGRRLCYNFNMHRGCTMSEPGKDCGKGAHLCMRCFGVHPAHQCPQSSSA